MSFPRYPKYKDSGVEWLGEVPEHWKLSKIKHIASITGGGTPNREIMAYWNGSIPWVSPKDMKAESIVGAEESITELGLQNSSSTLQSAGRMLMVIRSGILQHTIPVAINTVPVALNQDMKSFCFHEGKCLSRFFLRWVQGLNDILLLEWANQGATVESVNQTLLQNTVIPIPDTPEQRLITAFLDRETAKIDELVAEQRRLIELLKEKRQAVISQAVTKGLNPNAPLKPSGIEWLGDVPEHWVVVALKRIATIRTGVAKGKDLSGHDTINVPYLRVANVQDGYLKLDEIATIDIQRSELDRYRLGAGDVLMNEGGDFDKLGRGYVWEGQIEPCITQNHVFAVRPNGVDSWWLNSITSSDYAQFYFMSQSKQSTNLASINSTNVMNLPVILPPKHEQKNILKFVHETTQKFDTLTAEAQRGIELLQERRTALISAAVTGKIDVRSFAPQTPEVA
jgi:type I restriction enzyme S subunit